MRGRVKSTDHGFHSALVIKLKTAKSLGIDVPAILLAGANEIVE
jgi:hypothetical protein